MKKVDLRITKKRKLTAKEYGEAVREYYSPEKQAERREVFQPAIELHLSKRKEEGHKDSTFTNLHKASGLDSENFKKLIKFFENQGYKVVIEYDKNKEKDKVKFTWK